MLVPIFGSCPTHLNDDQDRIRRLILGELGRLGLEWRSLGTTDYPVGLPLREVLMLAKRCCGGMVLGFSQFESARGIWKRGTPYEAAQKGPVAFPTPWNGLEAGILFALGLPLIVFRDMNIKGGIFDPGVTDLFIHEMPKAKPSRPERKSLSEVLRKWAASVHSKYYAGH